MFGSVATGRVDHGAAAVDHPIFRNLKAIRVRP